MAKNRRQTAMRRLQKAEEVLRKHQGAPPPSRWWWWVSLVSSPRRWLHGGLGILRRSSWVVSSVLYRWMRRAPPSRGLVGDALATAVRHASSSARLPALTTVLTASLVGVEPSASTTSPYAPQEGVPGATGLGSLAGVAPVVASPSTSPPEGSHGVVTTILGRCVDASTAAITSSEAVPAPRKAQNSTILERYASGVLPPLRRLLQDTESFLQHMLFDEEEEEEEDGNDDPEKKRYAIYLSHVAKTPKDSIVCLMCFLEKGVSKTIPRSLVESHSVRRHHTPGIKCEKTGCMVRAKHKGDIGRHKYYCHDLKAGMVEDSGGMVIRCVLVGDHQCCVILSPIELCQYTCSY